MRKYQILPRSFGVAAMACLLQSAVSGYASAGPMTDDTTRRHEAVGIPLLADPEAAAVSAIAPAAAKPASPSRSDRDAVDPDERRRIVSYLILRGLQGAGPLLGAR